MTTKNGYRLVQRERTDADRTIRFDKTWLDQSGANFQAGCFFCHENALAAFDENPNLLRMALCVDCLRGIIRMLETAKEDRKL